MYLPFTFEACSKNFTFWRMSGHGHVILWAVGWLALLLQFGWLVGFFNIVVSACFGACRRLFHRIFAFAAGSDTYGIRSI